MKKALFLSIFLCFSICSFSQDIIITKDNERIEAKVLEINETDVMYELFFNPDGVTYLVSKSNIKTIVYQNGTVENFGNENTVVIIELPEKQETEKIFKNVIRFNPLATILGALSLGVFEFDMQYAHYFTRKVALPVEAEIFVGSGMGFSLLTGIEAVPATHRQKSGLFLQGLVGVVMVEGDWGFAVNPNIGYQLMTRKGFVFNVVMGPTYNTISEKIGLRFLLGLGFAF